MKTRDEFDWWLTCLPDKVKALRARLPELAAALDGSVASIEPLVAHLIAHHTYDALIAPAQAELLDQVAAYVGDVAERAMPGCGRSRSTIPPTPTTAWRSCGSPTADWRSTR
ncbi:MAG: hypothetical protein KBG48_15205 [Kofleriaceae bacterium]|nr:hypothetical protein [Kofleriaceae bacterium]MBP9168743.1 hypothetical protein [Kofleriaceae bacterium]MBP9861210.1 hypothetical protein [Kofleriaceae bacterium]